MRQQHKLYLYRLFTWWWPDSTRFMRTKAVLLRICGLKVGKNVRISSGVCFSGDGRIYIGNGSVIKDRCMISSPKGGSIVLGRDTYLADNVQLQASGCLRIGNGTHIFQSSILMANGKSVLRIGANCQIAHFVSLKTSHHEIDPYGKCIGGMEKFTNISIGAGCWLCASCVVIPGVTVGDHCLIAAGSVVIRDCLPYSLYAGCPASLKKKYVIHG